jgi:hypothetical protein
MSLRGCLLIAERWTASLHHGTTVGGVDVGGGVFVGPGVRLGMGVIEGVSVGGRTGVAVYSASGGYSSSMAEYQSSPLINANSVKRAPA